MDIQIYDTTLRDGTQREGLSLTCQDKLHIAQLLDDFGVAYIEGGWPGSNPKDADALYWRGQAWAAAGQFEKALKDYSRAIRMSPTTGEFSATLTSAPAGQATDTSAPLVFAVSPATVPVLGVAQVSTNRDEQISLYRQGLQLCPGDDVAHYELGRVLVDAGQRGEAEKEFEAALRINPDFAEARRQLDSLQSGR